MFILRYLTLVRSTLLTADSAATVNRSLREMPRSYVERGESWVDKQNGYAVGAEALTKLRHAATAAHLQGAVDWRERLLEQLDEAIDGAFLLGRRRLFRQNNYVPGVDPNEHLVEPEAPSVITLAGRPADMRERRRR